MKVLDKLNNLSEKDLNLKTMTKVRQEYISNEKFNVEHIASVSAPSASFAKWVLAADKMEEAYRKVVPKREKMKQAEEVAKKMKEELETVQAELAVHQKKKDDVENQKELNLKKKREIEDDIELTTLRFDRANMLIQALSTEKVSWEEKLLAMKAKMPMMMGDCLLSAGVMVYMGPFSGGFRNSEIDRWVEFVSNNKIIISEKFSLEDSVGDAMEIRKWTIKGLPNDTISREKGLTVYRSSKVPLVIDPQNQANKWIKNVEKDKNIVTTRLDKEDFMRCLEKCLTFGHPLLIESVPDDIDPVIYPILMKQTFRDPSAGVCIKIGENIFDYHSNFRCMLTTKSSNPLFPAEITCKVCVINFMITKEGLEDQLLELTVSKERPDLEESRAKIVEQNHNNTIKMDEIENEILTTLQNVEGNILDNEDAINTLKRSNIISQSIKERQKVSAENEAENEDARKVYRGLAYHGMILFFCCQSMIKTNKIYEYSLTWYNKMYVRSIDTSEPSTFFEQRIENIEEQLNYIIYSNVCRGLYEKDKLIFSLILAVSILRKEKKINEKQLMYFISPFDIVEFKDDRSKVEWMNDSIWKKARSSEKLEGRFMALTERIIVNSNVWENFYMNPKIEEGETPEPFEEATELERLILLKIFRPELMIRFIKTFVENSIGKSFIRSPAFDIELSYNESSFSLPLIFLLPGITPLASLESFAAKMKKEDLRKISLGQGQAIFAEREIEEAKVTGNWVILENCHLYPSWMYRLSQICEELSDPVNESKINQSFRLWLTTYPSEQFPAIILQNSIKMSNEPPEGLGTNMEQSFKSSPISDINSFFETHPNPNQFKTLVYSLCLFHSIVQERRNFGPIGWNIPYEFTMSDLRVSLLNLYEFTKNTQQIPYKALYEMISECNYGGRVTDTHDRRLISTLLQDIITPKIFYEGFEYNEVMEYKVPNVGDHQSYLDYISRLPREQPPELYGMHRNAIISKAVQETDQLTLKLMNILGSTTQSKSDDKAEDEESLTLPIIEMKKKIPTKFIEKMVNTKYAVLYEESMNTVLQQEVSRFNKLIERIVSTLSQLVDALKGDILMSTDLEVMLESINQKKIPKIWLDVSYPSLKPLASYIEDLNDRIIFFNHWIDNGVPKLFWLPGFFFTQSFLTGVLQNYSRKYKISIDLLDFEFEFGNILTEDPKKVDQSMESGSDGCSIYGLYFEGCGWDPLEKKLIESKGKETITPSPIIRMIPSKERSKDAKTNYECPVYKTMERRGVLLTTGHSTNFIRNIDVYTDVNPKNWTKRGVALICQLNE